MGTFSHSHLGLVTNDCVSGAKTGHDPVLVLTLSSSSVSPPRPPRRQSGIQLGVLVMSDGKREPGRGVPGPARQQRDLRGVAPLSGQ